MLVLIKYHFVAGIDHNGMDYKTMQVQYIMWLL